MLRVKLNLLSLIDGKYWYKHILFSGIGFVSQSDGRIKSIEIVDGELKGFYSPQFNSLRESTGGINITDFTEDDLTGYDPTEQKNGEGLSYSLEDMRFRLLLNGKAYTGIAYVFSAEFCVKELCYKDGYLTSDATWDMAGQLLSLSIEENIDQLYSWYADGVLKSAQISVSEQSQDHGAITKLLLQMRFSHGSHLSSLSIKGSSEALEDAIKSAMYFPIAKLEDFSNLVADKACNFYGDAVAYNIFGIMINSGSLDTTNEIGIPSNFLAHAGCIDQLKKLRLLKKINFQQANENEIDLAKKIKLSRPDIQVKVERMLQDKPGLYAYFELNAD